ncbi:MAG: hypothetical protein ACTHJR_04975 [Sphingomonas sp.]|uniref:hypothetical protein n=1 Tax=Sphingomonas sp. TaxID=28214 RepID=UPI003F7F7E4A
MGTFDLVFTGVLIAATIWAMTWFPDIPRGTEGHHEALTARFEKSSDDAIDKHPSYGDAAVAYVDRIADRQLTKARGILSFDGLILAFLGLIARSSEKLDIATAHMVPVLLLMGLLAGSSAICLFLFRARWGYVADLSTFSREIAATLALARRRSFWIERTVRLSLLSLAGIVVLVIATVIKG